VWWIEKDSHRIVGRQGHVDYVFLAYYAMLHRLAYYSLEICGQKGLIVFCYEQFKQSNHRLLCDGLQVVFSVFTWLALNGVLSGRVFSLQQQIMAIVTEHFKRLHVGMILCAVAVAVVCSASCTGTLVGNVASYYESSA